MPKMTIKGLDDVVSSLSRAGANTDKLCKKALYEGAKIVADEVRKGVQGIPVVDGYGTDSDPLPGGAKAIQKAGLMHSLGIATFRDNGGNIDTSVGFDGYNSLRTKKYPGGQPNRLIARSIESGTSFQMKHPFVRPAISRSRKTAEAKMEEILKEELSKLLE